MSSPNSQPSNPNGAGYYPPAPDPGNVNNVLHFEGYTAPPADQKIFILSDMDKAWRKQVPHNIREAVADDIMVAKAYRAGGHIDLTNPNNPNRPYENPLIGKPNASPQIAAVDKVVEAIGKITRAGKWGQERDWIVRAMISEVIPVHTPHWHVDQQVENRLRRMDLRYAFVPANLRLLYQAALEHAGDEKALRAGGILNPGFAQMLGHYLAISPQSLGAQLAGGPSVVYSGYLEQLDFIIRLQAAMQIQHPKAQPTRENPTGKNIWADIIHVVGPYGSQERPADSYLVARMHAYQTNVRAGVYNFPQPPQRKYRETDSEYERRYAEILQRHGKLIASSVRHPVVRQGLLDAVYGRLKPLSDSIQQHDEAAAAAQRERNEAAQEAVRQAQMARDEAERRNKETEERKKLGNLLAQLNTLVSPDKLDRIRREYEEGKATITKMESWLRQLREMASQAQANAASGNQNTSGNANQGGNGGSNEGADTPDPDDANTINADWREINDEPQTQPHPTPKPGMGTETSENRPGIWRTGGGDMTTGPERSN